MGEQEAKTFGRQLYSQAEQQTLPDIQGADGQWVMVFAMPLLHRMTAESKCS